VLFEGWMLGFKPLPVEVVQAVDPQVRPAEVYYKHLNTPHTGHFLLMVVDHQL